MQRRLRVEPSTNFSSYVGTSSPASSVIHYDPATGNNPGYNADTITDPAGAITKAAYPASPANLVVGSRPTSVTDPQSKKTNFTYNTQSDLLTSATDAAGSAPPALQASLAYNVKGQVTSATDGKSQMTTYSYDAADELSQVTPQPLTVNAPGSQPMGNTTYTYNANHELWKVIPQPLVQPTTANGQAMGTTVYTYDGLSRVATITDANGKVLTFGYDKNNRNTTIADSDGKTTTLGYDANGNVTSRTEGTNTSSYGYDKLSRKTSETFPSSVTNTYTYDKSGNLKTLTDPSGTATYTYDAINRTASVTAPTATTGTDITAWTYDDPGTTANPDTTHTLTTETAARRRDGQADQRHRRQAD